MPSRSATTARRSVPTSLHRRAASFLVCPPHPERVVVAKVASGAGIVAIGWAEVPVDKSAAVGRAVQHPRE